MRLKEQETAFKKILILAVTLIMIMALAACGNNTTEAEAEAGGEEVDTGDGTVALESANIGDYVHLGEYNGLTEWLVIDKQDGQLLLLAKNIIEKKPYNNEQTSITWEKSSIRTWLNGEYLQGTFNASERSIIVNSDKVVIPTTIEAAIDDNLEEAVEEAEAVANGEDPSKVKKSVDVEKNNPDAGVVNGDAGNSELTKAEFDDEDEDSSTDKSKDKSKSSDKSSTSDSKTTDKSSTDKSSDKSSTDKSSDTTEEVTTDYPDAVFLLSVEEVNKYFAEDEFRKAYYPDGSAGVWWLRSSGYHSNKTAGVTVSGLVDGNGFFVYYDLGIRPAIWVKVA